MLLTSDAGALAGDVTGKGWTSDGDVGCIASDASCPGDVPVCPGGVDFTSTHFESSLAWHLLSLWSLASPLFFGFSGLGMSLLGP